MYDITSPFTVYLKMVFFFLSLVSKVEKKTQPTGEPSVGARKDVKPEDAQSKVSLAVLIPLVIIGKNSILLLSYYLGFCQSKWGTAATITDMVNLVINPHFLKHTYILIVYYCVC